MAMSAILRKEVEGGANGQEFHRFSRSLSSENHADVSSGRHLSWALDDRRGAQAPFTVRGGKLIDGRSQLNKV